MTRSKAAKGETIVEVLLAITIAAFSLSTASAIAYRSNQKAMASRERNEATFDIQSQISALKSRLFTDPSNFDKTFGVPDSFISIGPARHFCLDAQSTGINDSKNQWQPFINNVDDTTANDLTASNKYDPHCAVPSANGTQFFIDTAALVTPASQSSVNRAVFRFDIRWSKFGSGETQKAEVFYRMPSPIAAGSSTGGGSCTDPAASNFGGPLPCINPTGPAVCSIQDLNSISNSIGNVGIWRDPGHRTIAYPTSPFIPGGCLFTMDIITWDEDHLNGGDNSIPSNSLRCEATYSGGQPCEEIFVEGFGTSVSCNTPGPDYLNCDGKYLFRSPLTPDIPHNRGSAKITFSNLEATGEVRNLLFKTMSLYPDPQDPASLYYQEGTNTANSVHGWCVWINNPNPSAEVCQSPTGNYTGNN